MIAERSRREKIAPQLIAKAPELRDRYLERVNGEQANDLIAPSGKYDVSRALQERAVFKSSEAVAPALADAA